MTPDLSSYIYDSSMQDLNSTGHELDFTLNSDLGTPDSRAQPKSNRSVLKSDQLT